MITALLLSLQLQVTVLKNFSHYGIRDSTRNWVVLHSDESCASAGSTLLYLRRSQKSYHFYITREGKIYQLVDPKWSAKHAGWSHFQGLYHWNNFSIGVAFQNCKDQSYTDIQYEKGKLLLRSLATRYKDIDSIRIVRHQDIAFFRGKRDPNDKFDMNRIVP